MGDDDVCVYICTHVQPRSREDGQSKKERDGGMGASSGYTKESLYTDSSYMVRMLYNEGVNSGDFQCVPQPTITTYTRGEQVLGRYSASP